MVPGVKGVVTPTWIIVFMINCFQTFVQNRVQRDSWFSQFLPINGSGNTLMSHLMQAVKQLQFQALPLLHMTACKMACKYGD